MRGLANITATGTRLLFARMHCLIIFALLLQSCAIITTETRVVPGKELSRTSLGFREIESKIVLKEITPDSVNVTRHVCEADFISVQHKGEIEVIHKRQELHCANAFLEYTVFQSTTLGVPFLYEMVTGFKIFRGMCDKGPSVYNKIRQEGDATVTEEMFDKKSTICRDVPVPDALVTIKFEDKTLTLATPASGTVALSPDQVAAIVNSGRNVSIDYQYESETKTTVFKQMPKPEADPMFKQEDNNAVVKNSANGSPESQMMGKHKEENDAVKNNGKLAGTAASIELKSDPSSSNLNSSGKHGLPEKAAVSDNVSLGLTLKLTVAFINNQAIVKKEYFSGLNKIATDMKANPKISTVVEGHADNIGSAENNLKMSLRRASAVKDILLKKHGIAAERVQIKGYGYTKPIADNETAQGRAKNRRAEILTTDIPAGQ